MEYINYIKSKTHTTFTHKTEKPVLSEEDEKFLNRITAQDVPRPFTPGGSEAKFDHNGDAQIALMDGAQNIALPAETLEEIVVEQDRDGDVKGNLPIGADKSMSDNEDGKPRAERKKWSWLRRDSRDRRAADQTLMADGLHDIAKGLKSADAKPNEDGNVSDDEAKKEEEDMMIVLEKMNLAAVNNRVFSISEETQDLIQKFNQVFKDLVKGVPTAYDDLESLLTNGDKQLQKTYNSLPPFLQKLIEKLPETMTKGIGPGVMTAAAESGKSGGNMAKAGRAAGAATKLFTTPSLKDLVAKPTAITTMLKSIINFLRARFPAFMGMNVLWSLAMFVLLFVFWYCHKRGREVRLEQESELTNQELARLDVEWRATHPDAPATESTTDPPVKDK